jgi:phage gp45-like
MISRALINRVNDGLKTQRLQLTLLADETEDDVEHMQPYGMSFVPPEGAEAVALAVGGARSHTIAICANVPGERPTGGAPRTGGLYTNNEWRLFIDQNGIVHIGAQSGAQFVALAQKVFDELNAVKADLNAVKSTFDAHTHILTLSTGTGTAAVPATPIPTPHTPQSVAATKAKAT